MSDFFQELRRAECFHQSSILEDIMAHERCENAVVGKVVNVNDLAIAPLPLLALVNVANKFHRVLHKVESKLENNLNIWISKALIGGDINEVCAPFKLIHVKPGEASANVQKVELHAKRISEVEPLSHSSDCAVKNLHHCQHEN